MKANFNSVPFTANLLIDNRAQLESVDSVTDSLKGNFMAMTPDEKNTLIMSTLKNSDKDRFELYNEQGEKLAKYEAPLSKFIGASNIKAISERLANIYEVAKIRASYTAIIGNLREAKEKYLGEIRKISENPSLSKEQKSDAIGRSRAIVNFIDKDIKYQLRAQEIDCDSYELSHGMKRVLN